MGIANMDDSNYDDTLYQLADLFKVFGDPTRIRILSVLSKQELCVQDIADALSMTQRYFTSASDSETVRTGQVPPGWKNHLLFPGRRSCGNHHGSGSGTCM